LFLLIKIYLYIIYMEDIRDSYGIAIAKNDKKLQTILRGKDNNDQEIINQYIILKDFSSKCSDSFRDDVINLLMEQNAYLQNKLRNKENQNRALLVVLDYLNTLGKQDSNSHMKDILNTISTLDREIASLQQII